MQCSVQKSNMIVYHQWKMIEEVNDAHELDGR
jgi:hypothetical protein